MSSSEEEAEFGGEKEEEEEEEEEEEDDEDDVPLSSLKQDGPSRGSKRKRKSVDYADSDDDDDDEDDAPLATLKKSSPSSSSKAKPKAEPKAKPKAKTTSKKKTKASPTKAAPAKAASSGASKSSGNYASPSAALYESESKKGMLIQLLLCRWWYAMEWPDKAALPKETPKHYDTLDGFEGVYVCTSGGSVGKIMDLRDKATCPSFSNFAKKSSKELKELLLKALEEQMKQLIASEGEGTTTEKELKEQIKLVKKIKVDEADSEASKVLKAAKMML